MSTSTHLITYEESLTMPESNLDEVIDGELLIMPSGSLRTAYHRSIALIRLLRRIFDCQIRGTLDITWGDGFLLKRDPLRYRIS